MSEGQGGMISRTAIFWDVDTQVDFMLPGGKLYVPGAEKLIPNLKQLTDAAREGRVFIIGDACTHTLDDPEFERFPPHCVRGTPGAEIIPETRADKVLVIPTRADAEIFVFGVVMEYCVQLAAKGLLGRGRRVALVSDAIETLQAEDGRKTLEELTSLGARLVTTEQALAALEQTTTHSA